MSTLADAEEEFSDYVAVAADLYDALRGEDPIPGEYEFYESELKRIPGPHLEIGCGTGRILLRLLGAGIYVEGLDSSTDMLRLCSEKAGRARLTPTLHLQDMLRMSLEKRYGAIFAPLATMMLLSDPSEVRSALCGFKRHLRAGGCIMFSIYARPRTLASSCWMAMGTVIHQGNTIRVLHSAAVDRAGNAIVERFKFENQDRVVLGIHRVRLLFWNPEEMTALLDSLGYRDIKVTFDHSDSTASASTRMMLFRAVQGTADAELASCESFTVTRSSR